MSLSRAGRQVGIREHPDPCAKHVNWLLAAKFLALSAQPLREAVHLDEIERQSRVNLHVLGGEYTGVTHRPEGRQLVREKCHFRAVLREGRLSKLVGAVEQGSNQLVTRFGCRYLTGPVLGLKDEHAE